MFVGRTDTTVALDGLEGLGASDIRIPIVMVKQSSPIRDGDQITIEPYAEKTLQPANRVVRQALETSLKTIPEGGKSFYLPPFRLAFDMLERSRAQNTHCNGQQLIVLLTDGPPSDTPAEQQTLLDLVTNKTNYGHPTDSIPIYSYALGNEIALDRRNFRLAKKLSCKTSGSYTPIPDGSSPGVSCQWLCVLAILAWLRSARAEWLDLGANRTLSTSTTKASLHGCDAMKQSGASRTLTRAV